MLALRCISLEKHCRRKYAAKLLEKSVDLQTTKAWILRAWGWFANWLMNFK